MIEIDANMLEIFNGKPNKREAIQAFENELLKMPQIDMEPVHMLIPGVMYARGLFMPKGSCVTGKIHIKEHMVIIAYGDVTVTTDCGTERYTGHTNFVGKPGSKRALLMHEDTFWWAIHGTDAATVEEAEQRLVTNDHNQYLQIAEDIKCLSS